VYYRRAMEISAQISDDAPLPSKVLLISSVIFGREVEMDLSEQVPPLPPQGYHSVCLIIQRWGYADTYTSGPDGGA